MQFIIQPNEYNDCFVFHLVGSTSCQSTLKKIYVGLVTELYTAFKSNQNRNEFSSRKNTYRLRYSGALRSANDNEINPREKK